MAPTPSDELVDELLALATTAAEQAADLLLDGLSRPRTRVETKSTGTDMVTEMDHAAEALIVERILDERPDDAIVGEEGSTRDGGSGVRWLVDPIDGTTNYLYRHPGFAVSIAAAAGDEVVAGAVAVPMIGDLFTAARDRGAWRNGEPIEVSVESRLGHALVATGFSYSPDERATQADVLRTVLPRVRDIRRMGAAAVDLCSVACGRVDAFFERGLSPWDHAAGALVVSEAGGEVGDLDHGPPSARLVLAANPSLYGELAALLRDAGVRDD